MKFVILLFASKNSEIHPSYRYVCFESSQPEHLVNGMTVMHLCRLDWNSVRTPDQPNGCRETLLCHGRKSHHISINTYVRLTVEIFIVILCIKWIVENIVVFTVSECKWSHYCVRYMRHLITTIPCLPPFSSIIQNLQTGQKTAL